LVFPLALKKVNPPQTFLALWFDSEAKSIAQIFFARPRPWLYFGLGWHKFARRAGGQNINLSNCNQCGYSSV
jgi:hypothetical protein